MLLRFCVSSETLLSSQRLTCNIKNNLEIQEEFMWNLLKKARIKVNLCREIFFVYVCTVAACQLHEKKKKVLQVSYWLLWSFCPGCLFFFDLCRFMLKALVCLIFKLVSVSISVNPDLNQNLTLESGSVYELVTWACVYRRSELTLD